MNNIAEGYEAGGNVMFKKFLQISRGSCSASPLAAIAGLAAALM